MLALEGCGSLKVWQFRSFARFCKDAGVWTLDSGSSSRVRTFGCLKHGSGVLFVLDQMKRGQRVRIVGLEVSRLFIVPALELELDF